MLLMCYESQGCHFPWPKPRRDKGDGCCSIYASLYVTYLTRGSHTNCLPVYQGALVPWMALQTHWTFHPCPPEVTVSWSLWSTMLEQPTPYSPTPALILGKYGS